MQAVVYVVWQVMVVVVSTARTTGIYCIRDSTTGL